MEIKMSIRKDTSKYTALDVYNEILEDAALLKEAGYDPPKNYTATISKRMRKTLGYCEEIIENKLYAIKISDLYLKNSSSEDVHNTIMHEVIHSLPGCMSHTGKWKRTANYISAKYPHFGIISRMSTDKEYDKVLRENSRYKITCQSCGSLSGFNTMNRICRAVIQKRAGCSFCKSKHFKFVDTKTNKTIYT